MKAFPECMVKDDTVQAYRNFYKVAKRRSATWKERPIPKWYMTQDPERYYDWMLWKMRQERNKMSDDPLDSPTDDVTKNDLIGWIEKPFLSREEMWMREIAEMQKTNHNLLMRVKEQSEEIQKLKKKIENAEL